MKRLLAFLVFAFSSALAFAQDTTKVGGPNSGSMTSSPVEMADTMRSNGKIYVVLAVVLVIFAGIIIYLVSIDRKVKKMEQDQDKK